MCDYCKKNKSLYYDREGVIQEIYIESDKTLTVSHPITEFSVNIPINYCMMCGNKLTEDK